MHTRAQTDTRTHNRTQTQAAAAVDRKVRKLAIPVDVSGPSAACPSTVAGVARTDDRATFDGIATVDGVDVTDDSATFDGRAMFVGQATVVGNAPINGGAPVNGGAPINGYIDLVSDSSDNAEGAQDLCAFSLTRAHVVTNA